MSAIMRQLIRRCVTLNVRCVPVPKLARAANLAGRLLSEGPKDPTNETSGTTAAINEIESEIKPKAERELYDKLVRANKVVVFMKGTPKSPRCGFSNAVVQIFRMHGVEYLAHDVLENDKLREGIKAYTEWPTIPQVFINGEFVGGCELLLEKHQNGELIEELMKAGIVSGLLRIHNEIKEKEAKAIKEKNKAYKKDQEK